MAEMNLLDNELVRKYFTCQIRQSGSCGRLPEGESFHIPGDKTCLSAAVIRAMQEPIRKGERYLYICGLRIEESVQEHDWDACWHPIRLRLPDLFQKTFCSTRLVIGTDKCGACGEMLERQTRHVEEPPEPPKCKHGVKETTIYPCNDCIAEMDKPKDPKCPICGRDSCWQHDAVEIKIKDIDDRVGEFNSNGAQSLEEELRELVKLARGK